MYKYVVAVTLSVPGETPEILRLATPFNLHHCQVISITDNDNSSLARIADFNLSYHMPQLRMAGVYDVTTQLPVIYILETIGRQLARQLK